MNCKWNIGLHRSSFCDSSSAFNLLKWRKIKQTHITLPKTNIAPEHEWFPTGFSFFRGLFSGDMLVSRRVFPTIGEKSHWRKMEKKGRKNTTSPSNHSLCEFLIMSLQTKSPVYPIPSMYGIFTYIQLIFMVHVGKYTIHGWYGYSFCSPFIASLHTWANGTSSEKVNNVFFQVAVKNFTLTSLLYSDSNILWLVWEHGWVTDSHVVVTSHFDILYWKKKGLHLTAIQIISFHFPPPQKKKLGFSGPIPLYPIIPTT